MSTIENREATWVARSDITSSDGQDVFYRVQETGGEADADAAICTAGTEAHELYERGSRQLFAIPAASPEIEGFLPEHWNPEAYQVRGVNWLSVRPCGALFLPPGMGKTAMALAAYLQLQEQVGVRTRMLILAPLTVCLTTWNTEPKKWRQFYGLKIGLAHGPDKALILNDPFYDIVVMNYDGIQWSAPLLAKGHTFTVLLCDELTRLKHTTSKRFKMLKPLLPSFSFRWGLTGTPAANGLMDLFGECYILDLGQSLGKYITHFRLKYFYQKSWEQYKWYIRDSDAERLVERISDMAMYLDPKDYITLPPLIDIELSVKLPVEAYAKYLQLEADFITKFNDDVVTAANAAVLTSKLRQYTGGAVYDIERATHVIHTAKLDRLAALVDELNGTPLMVAYQFEHEFNRLKALFPEALAIRGGMSKKQLSEVVESWNQNQTAVLLVQPTAAALGLNLQFGGSAICWFSLTYNLEEYIQLIARLLRRGQTKPVMNYILTAEKTIDAVVAKAITTKGTTQDSLFSSLKSWSAIKEAEMQQT